MSQGPVDFGAVWAAASIADKAQFLVSAFLAACAMVALVEFTKWGGRKLAVFFDQEEESYGEYRARMKDEDAEAERMYEAGFCPCCHSKPCEC